MAVLKAISNLIAVYEARNVIYVKRGGLEKGESARIRDRNEITKIIENLYDIACMLRDRINKFRSGQW